MRQQLTTMTLTIQPCRTIALFTLVLLCLSLKCQSLVVSAPRIAIPSDSRTASNDEQTIGESVTLRIRSTKASDVDQISGLLAAALVNPDDTTQGKSWKNWKISMELLKMKAALEKILVSRVHAIAEGKKVFGRLSAFDLLELSEFDILRFVWSNDGLRQNIERAARTSPEPHVWRGHNFDIAPLESCWLQHKMFTAEDAETGDVIGYCEVAMISGPGSNGNGECESLNAPTILNLVTSPKYRRRGIASRLMKTAVRYVSQEWSHEERLSLYVDTENTSAITMYSRLGFEKQATLERESRMQWYMSRQLDSKQPAETSRELACSMAW